MGERHLMKLGRRVAELQDQAPEARLDRAQGRARLLAAEILPAPPAHDGAPPHPPARRFPVTLALAAALAALVAWLVLRPRDPLRFELGAAELGTVGAWIAAPPAEGRPIHFSDGSLLRLAPGGRARVTAVDADGAEIALERGTLDVSVIHRAHTRWKLWAGPFQIHVIGTRFDVGWDPVTEHLDVALREGAITVSGPVVGEARAMRAGERIGISTTRGTLEVGAIDGARAEVVERASEASAPAEAATAPKSVEPPRAPPSATPTEQAAPRESAATTAAPEGSGEPSPASASPSTPTLPAQPVGWRTLALNAKYKDALAAAEVEGFDAICGSASVSDLESLAYVARLGGSATRAVQALTTLRRRFPGSPEASAAAFVLGRMAQDGGKAQASAAGWFTRYLSEQPSGTFAAEASGRLVEAMDRMGDAAGARQAATRYLTGYPTGPHAAYARSVLARGATSPAP